jgi:hypothetical protein
MKDPREIDVAEVQKTARQMVDSAHKSVCVTMSASEELSHPLPRDYFLLLEEKMRQGVTVERVVFGTPEAFASLDIGITVSRTGYTVSLRPPEQYRRMLLVDDAQLMFAEDSADGRHFYATIDERVIDEFRKFFRSAQDSSE